MAEKQREVREPYFAEYSLWNDSAYSVFSVESFNCIEFTRPVAGSIFLSPDDDRSSDEVEEEPQTPAEVSSSPGFERYMRRALKVVTREDLIRDPALFKNDPDSEDSESSTDRARDVEMFLRPPRPRWRSSQQVNGRGRRIQMQRRLEQGLHARSLTNSVDGDGRGHGGVVEKITPDPYYVRMLNAAYDSYCKNPCAPGLSPSPDSGAQSPDSGAEYPLLRHTPATRHVRKQEFILNVLYYIREFVKNDLQVELFFDFKLKPHERKRIHDIVNRLMGKESPIVLDNLKMVTLMEDIERRNVYRLGTQSEGDHPTRQMCIYKEAASHMYLVTPEDVRCTVDESNPFLRSIARHLKHGARPCTVHERIIDYFIEFAHNEKYTEFRFLGPYNMHEIEAMSYFFSMVTCLVSGRPYCHYPEHLVRAFERGLHTADKHPPGIEPIVDYPERLVEVFEMGIQFVFSEDANGFASIKKCEKKKPEEDNPNELKREI